MTRLLVTTCRVTLEQGPVVEVTSRHRVVAVIVGVAVLVVVVAIVEAAVAVVVTVLQLEVDNIAHNTYSYSRWTLPDNTVKNHVHSNSLQFFFCLYLSFVPIFMK